MGGRRRREIPASLAQGRDRFEAWRRTREVGTRIPERLWALAVKLAEAHGLHRTASVLRLDYYSLQKRVELGRAPAASSTPAFVELSPPLAAAGGECVIELADGAGASLRVHLKGYDAPDLVPLVHRLWTGA